MKNILMFFAVASALVALSCKNPTSSSGGTTPAQALSVTYNGNGSTSGTVPVDSNSYTSGAAVTVLNNTGTLAKTGYNFAGWNTKSDGSGTTYTAGQQFTISGSITLYAIWTTNTVYTVTFNASGGLGTMPSVGMQQGTTTYLPVNTFTNTGYVFAGWATSSGGSVQYSDQQGFTMGSANVTLYAVWGTSGSVIALYDFSGQDCADKSGKGNAGTPYNITYVSNGNGGYAASFDGSSSYIDLPSGLINSNSSAFTIMITFKTTGTGAFLGYQSWTAAGLANAVGEYTPLLAIESSGKLRGEEYMNSTEAIESSAAVNDGAWHTVYFTATSTSLSLKLDGVTLDTKSGTVSYFADQTFNQLGAANCQGRTTIPQDSQYWSLYNGQIGKFVMYNTALQ